MRGLRQHSRTAWMVVIVVLALGLALLEMSRGPVVVDTLVLGDGLAPGQAVPAAMAPAHPTPDSAALLPILDADPGPDGCADPIGRYLSRVAELRGLTDEGLASALAASSTVEPDASFDTWRDFARKQGFQDLYRDTVQSRSNEVLFFEKLQACAGQLGLEDDLRLALLATFQSEGRRLLLDHWLALLTRYGCDAQALEAVRAWVPPPPAGPPAPGAGGVTSFLMRAAICPDADRGSLLLDLTRCLGRLDELERTTHSVLLTIYFPFDESTRRIMLDLLEDPETAWTGVEMAYMYGGAGEGRASPADVQRLLESREGLLSSLLDGDSPLTAKATMALLTEKVGTWGQRKLIDFVEDVTAPAKRRASGLAFLATAEVAGIDWSYFHQRLEDPDPVVAGAAMEAIGIRAAREDAAFDWLRQTSLAAGDTERRLDALGALLASGRPERAEALLTAYQTAAAAEIRAAALEKYTWVQTPDLDVLRQVATDAAVEPDAAVRVQAAVSFALASEDFDHTNSVFETLLQDEDGDVRTVGLFAIGARLLADGDDQALQTLHAAYAPWHLGYDSMVTAIHAQTDTWTGAGTGQTLDVLRTLGRGAVAQGDPYAMQYTRQVRFFDQVRSMLDGSQEDD